MNYLNVKLDSYEYKILSDKDKLRVVKTKLNDLFENKKGKIVTTVYNGKKIDIPYWAISTFKDLNDREKALQKRVNIDFEYDFEKRRKEKIADNIIIGMSVNEEIDNELCLYGNDFFSKRKSTLNKKPYGVLNINDVLSNINDGKEEFVVPIVKNIGNDDKHNKKKGLFRGISNFSFIRKISDKFKNKNKVKNISEEENSKKRNIKVAAVALGLIATTMIGSFVPGMFKKKNNSNRGNIKPTSYVEDVTEESTIEDEVIYTTNNNNNETENVAETKETDNNMITNNDIIGANENNSIKEIEDNSNIDVNNYYNYTISFDDKVTINDNSYIYGSSYDAAGEKNSMTPLFDGSYERDVMGVVYNLDGNIYTIYSSDSHAYEKADELISKGAKEEAVLVTRSDLVYTGQYEGYYDIDDVNVKTLTKNR